MKVIKSGKWNNPWSDEFTCTTCGAVLHVEESDLKAHDNDLDANYFICVECGKNNTISKDSLPLRIKEYLNKIRKYSAYGFYDR